MYISNQLRASKIHFFALSLFLSLCSGQLSAQPRINQVEQLSVEEHLSSRNITQMLIGPEGFIWMATVNGLNKYDGYQIRVYNDDVSNSARISEHDIEQIGLDRYGHLLIKYPYNDRFLDRLNPGTGVVEVLPLQMANGQSGNFRDLYIDHQQNSWLLLEEDSLLHLAMLDSAATFQKMSSLEKRPGHKLSQYRFLFSRDQQFWIFDNQYGIRQADRKKGWQRDFPFSHFGISGKETIRILHEDRQGQIVVAFGQQPGLFVYDQEENRFKRFEQIPSDLIYDELWEDEKGQKILSVRKNNYQLDRLFAIDAKGVATDYSFLLEVDDKITHIIGSDFSSLLFLATLSGMKKVHLKDYKVQQLLAKDLNLQKGEWGYVMHGIAEAENGDLLMAREVKRWYRYHPQNQTISEIVLHDPQTGIPRDFHCSFNLIIDDHNKLWGSSCDQGGPYYFHSYDLNSGQQKSYLYDYLIFGFVKSRDGHFWLSTGLNKADVKSRLVWFDEEKEQFIHYTNKDGSNPLEGQLPRYIYESQNGLLWIGTIEGLVRVDRKKGTSKLFSSNEVMVIAESKDSLLCLGTSEGLKLFNPRTEEVKIYTQNHGLCNNNVCGILPDEKGNLWLSTFNGLAYFDREKETFYNFDRNDGFSHHEFNRFSFYKASDGRIYLGGMNGVNAFHPEELLAIPPSPPVRLTAYSKYNSRLDSLYEQTTNLQALNSVIIEPDDTYFQFNFSLTDFTDSKRNQYQVWLEGFEKSWTYLGTRPYIRYSNLPAGHYRLHIKGANPRGNWTEESLLINIEVKQVFYKTAWFITCCILSLLFLAYLLYRYRLNQLLKVERLRTKIASDLHDEIGSIMTRISIGTELLKEGVVSPADQEKELEHISQQSRQVTSIMSDVIWSIDARKDRLQDLIDRMREHLEELLGAAGIAYQLDARQLPLSKKLDVEMRQNLYFIFKESINNIVKHSNAKRVQVIMDNQATDFTMSIIDNGTISRQHHKTGQGLKNMALRADRIKAKLHIENKKGFKVILQMANL